MEGYKTLHKRGEAQLIEKKSRFIGTAAPAESEEAALAFIEEMRKKYRDANHNVFAYHVGELTRYSDNGEPSGTAGLPVLDVLVKEGITNAVIVVTRYFGGTLLGTGGLVRAYGHSAKEAVAAAGVAVMVPYNKYVITADYGSSNKIQYEATTAGFIIEDVKYAENVTFVILTDIKNAGNFIKKVTDITRGGADICFEGNVLIAEKQNTSQTP